MLELDSVTRRFGDVTALDSVSFRVAPGRLTGFVGANGAGKTTAMRIVLGITRADAGRVLWQGEPLDRATRARMGYIPEERGLYPKMGLLDQLVFFGRLHGLTADDAAMRGRALLERLGLGERTGDRLESLSLGNQQRVQVAAAVLHDPIALVLDEPFSGLDPLAVDSLVDLLRERAAGGVPVLFSSHQLDLVERLCDDLVVVDHGRVVAAGTAEDLRRRENAHLYRLVVEPDSGWLRETAGLHVVDVDGPRAVVRLLDDPQDGDGGAQRLLAAAMARGRVTEFSPVRRTLAEIYREVVR
ncbi:MAG: ABC transporter ATP-binding protein [Kineosporiaceae bacterium]